MKFNKVKKRFALNNSYFKNRHPEAPATPYEVVQYYREHNELPFDMGKDESNWIYECFVEYQKRAGVHNSQFFTPQEMVVELGYKLEIYANKDDSILEPCCGFGMITKHLADIGYSKIEAFDIDERLVEIADYQCGDRVKLFNDDFLNCREVRRQYDFIVSNPPYESLTAFLEFCLEMLSVNGVAILLMPSGFMDKSRPARLVQVLNNFSIAERVPMKASFARTGIKAEIVVLRKV